MVTTTVWTVPSAERIGVASSSVRTLRPSGTESSTSSARTGSALGRSASVTSRPSPRRQVTASASRSMELPGVSSPATMRFASRLKDGGAPVAASNTTTPMGEVSTSASRSARARRSSWCARACAMAAAACCANNTSTASSRSVNPPSFSPR